jgi:hypothetical protein
MDFSNPLNFGVGLVEVFSFLLALLISLVALLSRGSSSSSGLMLFVMSGRTRESRWERKNNIIYLTCATVNFIYESLLEHI